MLCEPTNELKDIVGKCDTLFQKFNGIGLRICKKPIKKLQFFILKRYPAFPPDVVYLFSKFRFYCRLKQLNTKIKLKRLNKSVRSFKQFGQFAN